MPPALPYIPRLDSFRAIAALMVIEGHYFEYFMPWPVNNTALATAGVGFFFVLSGFLITSVLLTDHGEPPARLRRFYIRRTFRIFPLYYFAVAAGIAFGIPGFWESMPWVALYLSNFCDALCGNGFGYYAGHLWTLAVEEQFYLFWPLVIIFAPTRVAAGIAILLIAAALTLFPMFSGWPVWERAPITHAYTLCAGALLAMAYHNGSIASVEKPLRWLLPLTAPSLLLLSNDFLFWAGEHYPLVKWPGRPIGLTLFMCWLIARAAVDGPTGSSWGRSWLPWLGTISYGIYVYHLPIRYFVDQFDPTWSLLWPRIAGAGTTIIVAWLSYRLMEKPLRRFGRNLAKRDPAYSSVHSTSSVKSTPV